MFAEELLNVFPSHDAGTLLTKALRFGAFEYVDIVAQALEYDTVKKTCEGPTDLERY